MICSLIKLLLEVLCQDLIEFIETISKPFRKYCPWFTLANMTRVSKRQQQV